MDRPPVVPVGIIVATFVAAFVLTGLPMAEWAAPWRPPWVALVLLYWCFAVPERVGILAGWGCGLILDVLVGTLMGQHALALAVVAWIARRIYRRVRLLPLWQQGLSVFGVMVVDQLIVSWITGMRGLPVEALAHLSVPLAAAVVWPWIFLILRRIRRRYQTE